MSCPYRYSIVLLWSVAFSLILANNAMAYVGPGAGMEFVTYAMGLIAMVGVAFLSVLMWPFYAFMRWLRGTKVPATAGQPSVESSENQLPPTAVVKNPPVTH